LSSPATSTTSPSRSSSPGDHVFEAYQERATQLPQLSEIRGVLLSPESNPWGAPNANGIYYMDTSGNDLDIEGSRIYGTLVVDAGGGTVNIVARTLLEPASPTFPTLIVNGDVDFQMDSDYTLDEADWGINFNPPGTPYQGAVDNDQSDAYPAEVFGLVHAYDDVLFTDDVLITGVVLAGDTMISYDSPKIVHDPDIAANPPELYTSYGPPVIVPGGWRQVLAE
jgi:hypothetical protein